MQEQQLLCYTTRRLAVTYRASSTRREVEARLSSLLAAVELQGTK